MFIVTNAFKYVLHGTQLDIRYIYSWVSSFDAIHVPVILIKMFLFEQK